MMCGEDFKGELMRRLIMKSIKVIVILEHLAQVSRFVCIIGIPPLNMFEENEHINETIVQYNVILKETALQHNLLFIDACSELRNKHLDFSSCISVKQPSVWKDEARLSDIGDSIVAESIYDQLDTHKILEKVLNMRRVDECDLDVLLREHDIFFND